jgi:hypothetical protein
MRIILLSLFGVICTITGYTLSLYTAPKLDTKPQKVAAISLDNIDAQFVKTQKLLDKVYKDCGYEY